MKMGALKLALCAQLVGSTASLCSVAQSSAGTNGAGAFVDVTANSGVAFSAKASHTSKKYLPETMGSGVAVFDYDNDGRLDIFLVNGAPLADPTPPGTIPKSPGRPIGT